MASRVTQFDDGTLLSSYYGCTNEDTTPWGTPHGIFVSLFDEEWLRRA